MVETVREFHRRNPLQPGIARPDLRPAGAPPFVLDALLTDAAGEIAAEGDTVRLRSHTLVLNEDERQARAAIERAFQQAGLAAPAVAQVLAQSGVEPARARSLLQILLREKHLVRINDEMVIHQSAIDELRRMLAARKPARFNVGTFKEWTGVSRKYAIPLLEFLDRERITRRQGEERLIL
jgi:selenocysteine-specific elongation factor